MHPFFSIVSGSYEYVDTLFGKTEDKSSTWINTRLWKNLYYDLGKGVYINTPLNLMKLREHSLCSKSLVFKFIKQVLMRIPCVSFSYFRKYSQALQCVRKYFILFYFILPCMSFLAIAIASVKSSRLRGASSIVHIGMCGDKRERWVFIFCAHLSFFLSIALYTRYFIWSWIEKPRGKET